MPHFSIIIPVYNRPGEIAELLESLSKQLYSNFEVVIVEDGSTIRCEDIVRDYATKFPICYYFKENSGPGLSRNYGAERAHGDYFIFLDSDCLIPAPYLQAVNESLDREYVDLFGGPDREHESFTILQKAINYSMTAMLTTGGIRGRKKSLEKFNPRSFNMGISRRAFEVTRGFGGMRAGEDIDMSIRIRKAGFESMLIPEAFVYHKRRVSFRSFFRQVYAFGKARIDLYLLYPESMKIVHVLPALFVLGSVTLIFLSFFCIWAILPLLFYFCGIFAESLIKNKNLRIALLSILTSVVQLSGYGCGFIKAFICKIVFKKHRLEFTAEK